jgi:hypothetical protein
MIAACSLLFFLPTHARIGAENDHGDQISFRERQGDKVEA